MADLNQIYGVNYYFNGTDNVSQTIKKIQSSVDSLEENFKRSGTDLDNLFQRVKLGLTDLTAKVEEAQKYTSRFFEDPSENSGKFADAVNKAKAAIDECNDQMRDLLDLQQKIEAGGGDTTQIDDAIGKLKDEYRALDETLSTLVEVRMSKLAQSYNAAGDASEREKIRLQALGDLINTFGKTSQEAGDIFTEFVNEVSSGNGRFVEFAEAVESVPKKGKGFSSFLGGIAKSLGGNSGLGKVLSTVTKGFAGVAGGIALMAAKFVGSQIKKKINELTKELINAIKSIGEFKRALREGFANATVDAQGELRKLDELNTKLKTAHKSSAEYNQAKSEIISQYGKYNQYLDSEIKKVGDLSSVYDQLRRSIVEASVEKQRDKLINETSDKYGDRLTSKSETMLKRYQREFRGDPDRALAAFRSWRDSQLLGTQMSEDAQRLAWMRPSRRFQTITGNMNKRISRINDMYSMSAMDTSPDYTEANRVYDEEMQRAELIRKAKQYETNVIRDQDQMVVNAMRDGYSKQYAQAKLNYQRQLDQIDDFKEQFVKNRMEMAEASYVEAGHDIRTLDKNGTWYKHQMRMAQQEANEASEKMRKLEEQMYRSEMAEIAFQQRQSLISSYGTFEQQKQGARERWNREEITKEFRERADAVHAYEFAQMDYESIQKYGSQDQIREALEKMLDAEIKTLEDFEKPAAEARKRVTLAEFDADLAEKYAGRADQRKALEEKLNAELETIDEKYREIQEASNKVALAEFDQETVDKYGSRAERRGALENTLAARLEEFVKKNGEAQKAIIEAQNEYELANFDYEEIVDYGSYDAVLAALRKKWQAFIATLPEDLKKGATKQMNAEIYELQRQHEGVYQKIFANMDNMTSEAIDRTIALAEEELRHLSETGEASADVIGELAGRIDELRAKRDELDFGGWGGSLNDIRRLDAERRRNRQHRGDIVDAIMFTTDPEEYEKLKRALDAADDAENRLTEDIKKQASVLVASGIADLLSEVGGMLTEIAQAGGNGKLSSLGESLSTLGSSLSNIATGFATGGPIGGFIAALKDFAGRVLTTIKKANLSAIRMQKAIEQFSDSVALLRFSLDSSKFENIFGTNSSAFAADAYAKSADALKEYQEALAKVKNDLNDDGWISRLSVAFGAKGMLQGYFAQNIFDENGDIDVDKAKAFLETQTILTEEQAKQIQQVIALKEAYEEARVAAENYVSSFVGGTVSDLAGEMLENFLETGDAVMDLTDNMDSFAQAIAKSAIEARLLNEVFTDDMQQKMVDLIVSGNNAGAIDLYNQLLNQANSLAPSINEFLSGIGINPRDEEEEDRRARTRSSLGASQDSIDESNARLTAIQSHTYSMMEDVKNLRVQNESLSLITNQILAEVMGIHVDTTNAGLMMEEMMGYIKDVRSNMNVIVDRGVTML